MRGEEEKDQGTLTRRRTMTYEVIVTKFDGSKFTYRGLTLRKARKMVADILRHHEANPTTSLWIDAEIWVA